MIQRPGYPLYSLSLTAAIACLIYKYKCDYYVDEYLIDTLILEKIKEVLHFVKKFCRINLKYERYMVEEIRKVLDPFGTYTDNMFDPLDPFNLLSVIYFHDDI
ncbi:23073_t:CDS:2 [Rhizophagus irregularis]|nr:23073_t:CDS:2 [Rhizophagus irregularis]